MREVISCPGLPRRATALPTKTTILKVNGTFFSESPTQVVGTRNTVSLKHIMLQRYSVYALARIFHPAVAGLRLRNLVKYPG